MKTYQALPQPPAPCPVSRLGHSWMPLAHTASDVTQRCRFCRQERTIPLFVARTPRTAQKGA